MRKINQLKKKEFYFKSDIVPDYNQGRPFGGQAWFINYNMNVFKAKFTNKNVSYNHIGTLNADSFRKKKFDDLLVNFIDEKSLIPLDLLNIEKIDFTYHSFNNFMKGQSVYKAKIDDFLYKSNSVDFNIQCNIIDDVANTSDHRSLTLDIFLSNRDPCKTPRIPNEFIFETKRVDFSNPDILEFYISIIDTKFKVFNLNCIDNLNKNQNLNEIYSEIRIILISTTYVIETYDFSKSILQNFENSKFNESLKNKWFIKELRNIKDNIMFLKQNFNKNNQIKFEKKN